MTSRLICRTVGLATAFTIALSFVGCAKKKLSDRDTKREQRRVFADSKRQELNVVTGTYSGTLRRDGEIPQTIILQLEVKDVPDTSNGEIDAVLVPTLSGSLKLTYGAPSEGEFFGFATQKADYDANRRKLDLVLLNQKLKEMALSLDYDGSSLTGTWSAPAASAAGSIELKRAPLAITGEKRMIRGEYQGFSIWEERGLRQWTVLTLSTPQDAPDTFTVRGSARMVFGDPASKEAVIYEFDQVEFNPLTSRIVIRGTQAEISFAGTVNGGAFLGDWYTTKHGKMGPADFRQEGGGSNVPENTTLVTPLAGTYFGQVTNTHPDTHLPQRLHLSFLTFLEGSKPGSLGMAGSARLYFGSFSSSEYLELPFTQIEYNLFARTFVAKTADTQQITLLGEIRADGLHGTIGYGSLGVVGQFFASTSPPSEPAFSIAGDYLGFAGWQQLGAQQNASLNLVAVFDAAGAIQLTGTLKLIFGSPAENEQVLYRLDKIEFNPVTGLVAMKGKDIAVTIRGHLSDGSLSGEWITDTSGRMGEIRLAKTAEQPSPGVPLMSALQGTYHGKVKSNGSSNLPERIRFGLISTPDLQTPGGLKVSGNVRFYHGPFESNEYDELPFSDVQYDYYTRKLSAKTGGSYRITFKAVVGVGIIRGDVWEDTLGNIGSFEKLQITCRSAGQLQIHFSEKLS